MPGSIDEPVPDVMSAWANRNGCDSEPTETVVSADTDRIAYACPSGADVQLYRVDGGGHAWPGSEASAQLAAALGKTTLTVDATALIWDFFEHHALTR